MVETNLFAKKVSSRDAAREPAGMQSRRVLVNRFVSGTASDQQTVYLVAQRLLKALRPPTRTIE